MYDIEVTGSSMLTIVDGVDAVIWAVNQRGGGATGGDIEPSLLSVF